MRVIKESQGKSGSWKEKTGLEEEGSARELVEHLKQLSKGRCDLVSAEKESSPCCYEQRPKARTADAEEKAAAAEKGSRICRTKGV